MPDFPTHQKTTRFRSFFFATAIAELSAIAVSFSSWQGLEAWQLSSRFTGRVSFFFFAVFYLLERAGNLERRSRGQFSGLFAVLHSIHFGLLFTYNQLKGGFPVTFKLAGGATAYLLLLALPFIVSNMAQHPNLKRIYSGALHFILLIFILTYVSRLWIEPVPEFATPAGWVGLLTGIGLFVAGLTLHRQKATV